MRHDESGQTLFFDQYEADVLGLKVPEGAEEIARPASEAHELLSAADRVSRQITLSDLHGLTGSALAEAKCRLHESGKAHCLLRKLVAFIDGTSPNADGEILGNAPEEFLKAQNS